MYLKFRLKNYVAYIFAALFAAAVICLCTSGHSNTTATTAVAAPNEQQISLPIIMYHGILNSTKSQGEYVISPAQFEEDLKNIKTLGYNTIVTKDLIDYVYSDKALPKNPIMITFDDGYYNNYVYAFPLLKKYNCKAVLSPIAYFTDQYSESKDVSPMYGHCTWSNLKEMVDSGYIELANHSYNMHSTNSRLGIKRKSGENVKSYIKLISDDIKTAQQRFKENLDIVPLTFTYPFGATCKEAEIIVKNYDFKCTLICTEKINFISKNKNCLQKMGRFLRSHNISSTELFRKLTVESSTEKNSEYNSIGDD